MNGDSMEGVGIFEGDILIVDRHVDALLSNIKNGTPIIVPFFKYNKQLKCYETSVSHSVSNCMIRYESFQVAQGYSSAFLPFSTASRMLRT